MRIFNADGGEAELSGNGLRCLAAYLYHRGTVAHDEVQIDTLAGRKRLRLVRKTGLEYWFDVEMGRPILDRKQIAFRPGDRAIFADGLRASGRRGGLLRYHYFHGKPALFALSG